MEEYIADSEGHIDYPGHVALYPPGTKVFFQNGQYAGHETPVLQELAQESAEEYPPEEQVSHTH